MTFLTRLNVVNDMLALMGEAPLNTEDEGHPLYPQANRTIDTASYRVQARSWWFNTELVELTPDAITGHILLPTDTIRVDPREPSFNYVQRGRKLYNPMAPASVDKYVFTAPVKCWLVRHIPFTDLPLPAQLAVSYTAQMDFQVAYDADSLKLNQLRSLVTDSYTALNAEHIRNINVNFLETPSVVQTMQRIGRGGGY